MNKARLMAISDTSKESPEFEFLLSRQYVIGVFMLRIGKSCLRELVLIFVTAISIGQRVAGARTAVLPIPPVIQQTPQWCWLAMGEMVFRYYHIPPLNALSYQCGMVGTLEGPGTICFTQCGACAFGAGSDQGSVNALNMYPAEVTLLTGVPVTQLGAQLISNSVSPMAIVASIKRGIPIPIGITPSGTFQGQAEHDVLIIGYSTTPTGFNLVINDPFPYDAVLGASGDPYYAAGGIAMFPGQFLIPVANFANSLQWSYTITLSPH